MLFHKPIQNLPLELQDDHYRRMADLAFRHLNGAWINYKKQVAHKWVLEVHDGDSRWGRAEYLVSLQKLRSFESEEYTQSIGATLFSHVWLLSAANLYRLKYKSHAKRIKQTHSLKQIVVCMGMRQSIVDCAEELQGFRDTIMHLIEPVPKTKPLHKLNFEAAFKYCKVTWIIYGALLRNYSIRPDRDSWRIQTTNYGLPAVIELDGA